ncbi:uncharacterized protein KIAA0232 homolog isoform X1 [Rhincodon typus]|uniref:uncharacterized protein KIAA0232 homolog isoform X1 n=1 Tax=Rhincodon typus TaxID=259920 RepID=UPI00202DD8E9|nr:uncharacterized protein KIAA0232 homolog isoform X1 [Rhincodon typus]XP_048461510.1 uncharacterized protein KIAA0232 homolog isoform X1 [Rhincodon typus]XP_048461515.1 uncharacterized protein KIAA0232 homolog isoform X1 [Rhincodon typus]XP_048461521.1 uncharacterized protein KIAA0232 homolog isoform X1 [Rhincodon typus]XP_048461525.1 uncharacterized protein KIAA0232 homolog isoform X1 [Rhincodon typus]XP_048461529.1 uncharacterized protein KIAA0232 homolog isoform X1 [Rhincodon typus]XP_04
MHPTCPVVVEGPPSEGSSISYQGLTSAPEMSLFQALGPVQTWLGQELEKCGIDAMIYTRYVLSLLLHDSYDYDLQEQENDIFLGWEKGTTKKWGKGKKKCSDLSVEEMKKQAAVQCLRSASDESSGIETLVEELCSKLKELQNKQKEEKQVSKKAEGSQTPEIIESPSTKDQVEMYYEAFPPLSEKPICLQEIMTVWNKAKACSFSGGSSSSAAPQTSTDTSSPKDCNSEGEGTRARTNEAPITTSSSRMFRRSKKEKENRHNNSLPEQKPTTGKKQIRHRSEGKMRPRSWSSGSSEAGSSSSGNQYEFKGPTKAVKIRHKMRETARNKKGRNGQVRLSLKSVDKDDRKSTCGSSSSGPTKQLCKKGKRFTKETRRKTNGTSDTKDLNNGSGREQEFKEEPLWYTEPIAEYWFPPSRKSKLETAYRNSVAANDSESLTLEELSETMQGLCISNNNFQTYLAAGAFVDGHFVEMPALLDEANDLTGTSSCSNPKDSDILDDMHLSEFTHFYEVDIHQSILDPSASNSLQGESRILSMIRRKSTEQTDFEADCCIVLDGLQLTRESAIWTDSQASLDAEGLFLNDLANIAQFWECSSSEAEGESFAGDSPITLSPIVDNTVCDASSSTGNQEEHFSEANEGSGLNSTCFSLFEVQYDNSTSPFCFDGLSLGNQNSDIGGWADLPGKTQSRLLIWTKNSAFDENDHCSNLSTRTCSPWSHSEETRSDIETSFGIQMEESTKFNADEIDCIVPGISSSLLDEDLLDLLHEDTPSQTDGALRNITSMTFKQKSKLESVCGIQLEEEENKECETVEIFAEQMATRGDSYGSEVIKDIWTAIAENNAAATLDVERSEEDFFSGEVNGCHCCCLDMVTKQDILQEPREKAVQRSEYHLWECQKENLEAQAVATGELAEIDVGDYTAPSKPWDIGADKESAFILGGVYGELKTFDSCGDWGVVPPDPAKGTLLQCAASDVVTIAGTDVFMTPGSNFAPGHRPLWRSCASFTPCDQTRKGDDRLNTEFSFIFHEDLLGNCSNYQSQEPSVEYSFSSFDLNNPFSQVLHVECSFEPERLATFSPGFKPKSILCSDSESETFHPKIYSIDKTQYRAIRISPRTHFRPISASELSPGGGSESEFESEKEDVTIPVLCQTDLFEDQQADLKPLEEDAEREGHYYGKLELESGKFLPRLKKAGMEKSAQTSLDSHEGSGSLLQAEQQCPECNLQASIGCTSVNSCEIDFKLKVPCEKLEVFQNHTIGRNFSGYSEETDVRAASLQEVVFQGDWQPAISVQGKNGQYDEPESAVKITVPSSDLNQEGESDCKEEPDWWQETLYPQPFPRIECAECYTDAKEKDGTECPILRGHAHNGDCLLQLDLQTTAACEVNCRVEHDTRGRSAVIRRKLFSSDCSSSDETASEGGSDWDDPPDEELFSRTHL